MILQNDIAGDQTTIAGGIMNTGSNIMGFLAIPILAYFLDNHDQLITLGSCSLFAILAAVFWVFVDANKQIGSTGA